jgi:peptide/nickel transport system substrate-binding protein
MIAVAITSSCGHLPNTDSSTSTAPLTIGVPEGNIESPEGGAGQLANEIALEGLTQVGIDGRAMPRLAKSWNWENGERRLRLRLRDDVVLHDGRRFDSQLAAEALAVALAKRTNRNAYPALTEVTAARPDGPFELLLDVSGDAALLPEDLTVDLDIPVGPYREIKRSETTADIEFEAFDQYYLGRPSIGHVTLRPLNTLRTGWASLLRGELDMVYDVPADAIELIRNDDVQVVSVPRWYQYLVAFNSQKGPFRLPLVRKALNLAVNRQALIEEVLNGRGTPSTGPVWPRNWAYDVSVAPLAFDPTAAALLLDTAGFPLPKSSADSAAPPARLRFVCLIPENFSVYERVALQVQRDLFNVGVDMQFRVVPFGEYNTLIGKGQFDAALIDLISGPTPERPFMFWRSAREFQGQFNVFGYENREAERAFDVLRTSTNEAAVRSATSKLQRVMIDDPPALFVAWNERARAIRRDIVVPKTEGDLMWTLWSWSRSPQRIASAQ